LDQRIRVLLSLGTGRPRISAFRDKIKDIATSIIAIADETQNTADTFDRMHPELALQSRYFRLNPPDISEVGWDEASKRAVIAQRCEVYGEDPETQRMVARWTGAAGDRTKCVGGGCFGCAGAGVAAFSSLGFSSSFYSASSSSSSSLILVRNVKEYLLLDAVLSEIYLYCL
jgi:hypothetical protein